MKKLAVFYHLAAVNDRWRNFINEQIGLIQSSGLAENATVNITCAAYGKDLQEIKSYLQTYYSFTNLISVRSLDNDENIFEGQPLSEIQKYSKENEGYVLYIHSKGISHPDSIIPITDWRHYLNYWMIEKWEDCIKLLDDDISVVGTNWSSDPHSHFSGNFWWARTDHIKTLPDVLNRSLYYDESLTELLGAYTFAHEMWVLSEKCKFRSIHTSAVNHYYSPYPRERYVK